MQVFIITAHAALIIGHEDVQKSGEGGHEAEGKQVGEQLAADGYVVLVAGWIVQINASQSVVWSVA